MYRQIWYIKIIIIIYYREIDFNNIVAYVTHKYPAHS